MPQPAWFCKIQGKVYGPYTGDHLRQMVPARTGFFREMPCQGESGEWFAAAEMENLFPDSGSLAEDEEESAGSVRRQRKGSGKPSNYYRVFFRNLTEGGQWRPFLGVTIGVGLVLVLVFFFINLIATGLLRHPGALVAGFLLALLFAFILPAVFLFADGLLFGIPCVLMRVRLDARCHSALDLLALCHLIGLGPKLVILIAAVVSPMVGVFLAALYPFVHAGVLAYFMIAWWGFTGGRALTLAAIRFTYQMLFVVGYIAFVLLL